MIEITEFVVIQRPVQEVFAVACSYQHDPQWRTGIEGTKVLPTGAPLEPGVRTRETMELFGRSVVVEAEVIRYVPGRIASVRLIQGPATARAYRRVTPVPGGTLVAFHVAVDLSGWKQLLAPVVTWRLRRRIAEDLERLKILVETAAGQPVQLDGTIGS